MLANAETLDEIQKRVDYLLSLTPTPGTEAEFLAVESGIRTLANVIELGEYLPSLDAAAGDRWGPWRRFRDTAAKLQAAGRGTPPGARDWRDLAGTCRELLDRLAAAAGTPIERESLEPPLAALAIHQRRLELSAIPLSWDNGRWGDTREIAFENLGYCYPHGLRAEKALWTYVADGATGTVRQAGDHEQARQEAAAVLQSWVRFADRRAAELAARTATPPAAGATPGTGQDEGTGKGSQSATTLAELPAAQRNAYYSLLYAEARCERKLQDPEAYEWLQQNGTDGIGAGELASYDLPLFDTWARNVRRARRRTGERKYTPRTK